MRAVFLVEEMVESIDGGDVLVPPWERSPWPLELFRDRSRESDVHWPFLSRIEDRMTFTASGVRISAPDSVWSEQVEGLMVSGTQESMGSTLILTRAVEVSEPVLAAGTWDEAREMRRRLLRWSTQRHTVLTH